ncbi:MAG: hypothetical protein GY745_00330 [Actinomycetia bacterium]|nr:hypothetical protein [Actinomycetes bacterium]
MNEQPEPDDITRASRRLLKVFEPVHSISYYSPEIQALKDDGFKGWWHAYFAYRSAPMGPVGPETVTAAFYNFAPSMVGQAIPGVWDIMSPEDILERRLVLVSMAMQRIFGDDPAHGPFGDDIRAAAALARAAIDDVDPEGRVLFAAHTGLAWPDEVHLQLWHACTLLREHRFDGHSIALAGAEVDGLESHVLMAGRGYGDQASITAIRGWTDDEWESAVARMALRGWTDATGTITDEGNHARRIIERHTDRLASAPLRRLGQERTAELEAHLSRLAQHLIETGEVAGRWPPPHLRT